jgi:hypothetical protein
MTIKKPTVTSYFAKAIIDTMDEDMFYRIFHNTDLKEVLDSQQQGTIELIDNDTLPAEVTDDIIDFKSKELYHHFLALEAHRLEEIVNEVTYAFKLNLCQFFAATYDKELHDVKTITTPMYEHRIKSLQKADFTEWDG